MTLFDPTISKRVRRRNLRDRTVEQTRWFVNFRDPDTGQRETASRFTSWTKPIRSRKLLSTRS